MWNINNTSVFFYVSVVQVQNYKMLSMIKRIFHDYFRQCNNWKSNHLRQMMLFEKITDQISNNHLLSFIIIFIIIDYFYITIHIQNM